MSAQLVTFEAQLKLCVESFSHALEVAETAYTTTNNNTTSSSSTAAALPLAHLRSMSAASSVSGGGGNNGTTTTTTTDTNNNAFSDLDLNAQKALLTTGNTSLSAAATKINRNIQVLHDMVSQGRCGVDPAMEANIMEDIKRMTAQNMALRSEVINMYDKTTERYNNLKSDFDNHAQQTLQHHE